MEWGRRALKIGLIMAAAVLLGVEIYMESHFQYREGYIASEDTASILREVPEVEITEEDRALMAKVVALPSVRELLERGEVGSLADGGAGTISAAGDPEVAEAAGEHLSGESARSLDVSVTSYEDGAVVDLGWMDGERTFFLETAGDGAGYYKFYSPKQGTSYDNWDNERAQQVKVRRRWLAWLRDRVWEDE